MKNKESLPGKIAVNTRLLLKGRLEGIGRFSFELLKRITVMHPETKFFFLFDRPYADEFIFGHNVTPIVLWPPARHPLLYMAWFEYSVSRFLKQHKIDLFISPDGYLPLRSKVPSIAVIHDLNFEHYPQHLPFIERFYYRKFFPRFARKATRIVTVSRFSQQDIIKRYHIDPAKIDVVSNGVSEGFAPLDEAGKAAVKNRYTAGKPYFLYAGSINPRKNIGNMLEAHRLFRQNTGFNAVFLIVGRPMWKTDVFKSLPAEIKNDIVFSGYLPDSELKKVFSAAHCLLYVSLFEGFGIPLVEAFASETPVITSTTSALPEIAGNAALLVDPLSPVEIAAAMGKITRNTQIKHMLIQRGLQRVKDYSWEQSALLFQASVEKAWHPKD